ncbi:hypothetical protein CK203_070928 [Vitis vinifera]|uniref:HMG box domain-containing protein n=1 Tax=Vitis vinifera TaxID=29760 RepID=A0A438E3P9_VITVI|nr:hypothetical protein CK203_070928 [Vitis vinifera]
MNLYLDWLAKLGLPGYPSYLFLLHVPLPARRWRVQVSKAHSLTYTGNTNTIILANRQSSAPARARLSEAAERRGCDGESADNSEEGPRHCHHGCGVSVAIALADMHDCGLNRDVKRFKGQRGVQNLRKQTCLGEPRSPFRLFMENFRKASKTGNPIHVDRIGFEAWKKMSMEERKPYIIQAEKVNSEHLKILLKEEHDRVEVDDEADSAMVGKFDKVSLQFPVPTIGVLSLKPGWMQFHLFFYSSTCDLQFYGFYEDSEDSDSFQSFRSKTIESFNTFTWYLPLCFVCCVFSIAVKFRLFGNILKAIFCSLE